MHHDLKIHPQHYTRIEDGSKTFEIRVNDRAYQKGDTVKLRYFDNGYETDKVLGPFLIGVVYPIDSERVVFSILPIKENEG